MVDEDCKDLDEIFEEYELIRTKYQLPDWNKLEEDFDVSKAFTEARGIILRDIRRKMNEKVSSYLHLLETFLNPQATPMFIMNVLKNLKDSDWEEIRRIYKELAKIQFKQILADTIYSEEKEAEIINEISGIWNNEKLNLAKIIRTLDKNYSENSNNKKKSYFG